MKVLYWAENFWPGIGGVETFSQQLIRAMQARGHTFTVVTSGQSSVDGQPEIMADVPVWRFPFAVALDRRDLRQILTSSNQLNHLLHSVQPDLIHLNTIGPSAFFYLRNPTAIQTPTLLTLHMPLSTVSQPGSLASQVLHTVTHLVAISRAILQAASLAGPSIAARASLIYNALETPPLEPTSLPFTPPVLLCAGRLTEQKGFNVAIDAFNHVLTRYPTATLLIAGNGELKADLEHQAIRLGLGERVRFLGRVSHQEIYRLLNQATMMLIPSRYEPFGLVALEAAQMARPVVASRVDGLAEVVVHEETGLLVEPDQSDQLASAILSLLENPTISQRYGRQAQQRAKRLYSFNQFVDAYDALYHRIC
jgi:glycosyltransferase involved in cell wall biosynthesis